MNSAGGKEAERVHQGDTASKDQGPMVRLVLDGRHTGTETEGRQGPSGQAIFKPFRWSRRAGTRAQGLELQGSSQLEMFFKDCY